VIVTERRPTAWPGGWAAKAGSMRLKLEVVKHRRRRRPSWPPAARLCLDPSLLMLPKNNRQSEGAAGHCAS